MAKFYLNYVTEHGEAPSRISIDVADGASFTFAEEHLPTLSVDGYQFEGWLFIGNLISAGYTITEIDDDIAFTLIAQWTKELNICSNASGGFGVPKSFVIVDEDGNELTGVVTDEVKVFDATPADVKIGKTFASENGILEGEDTRTYRTTCGKTLVLAGKEFSIDTISGYDQYDYTKLQCIIAPYSTTGIAADKIVVDDCVYLVSSVDKIADVTKNTDAKSIDFNIVNNTENVYVVYYFTYRQED